MNSKIALVAAIVLLPSSRLASAQAFGPCQRGTLASYIALGAGGCMFQSALYRDFTYAAATTNSVAATDIIVDPVSVAVSTSEFPGLNFIAPWSVAAGQSETSMIGYSVVPFPPAAGSAPSGTNLTLDLGTVSIGGIIGSVTINERITTAGVPATTNLEVFETCADACSTQRTESVTLSPVATLQTLLTLSLSGGTGGVKLKNFAAEDVFAF